MIDLSIQSLIERIDYLIKNNQKSSKIDIFFINSHEYSRDEKLHIKINSLIDYAIENKLIWSAFDSFKLTKLGETFLKTKNQVTIE